MASNASPRRGAVANGVEHEVDYMPGYYIYEGKPQERALQNTNFGLGPVAFYKLLEDWREEGQMQGLRLA